MTLDDPGAFQRADPHRVAEILAAFPAQCREAQALRCEPPVPRERPSLVIIAGMGGSAAGADLLAASCLEQLDVPILVHRGYGLPAAAGKHALVVTASYSGETAEVLSATDAARERGSPARDDPQRDRGVAWPGRARPAPRAPSRRGRAA